MQRFEIPSLRRGCRVRRLVVPVLVLALTGSLLWCQEVSDLRGDQAIELYDSGSYAEARELLEQLDAEGALDGALLYRLSYCRRVAGDAAGEQDALTRAIAALEKEHAAARDLETPFYLGNAYRNARRLADARTVAAGATTRVESGELPAPEHPMDMFRLAKLYADQGKEQPAIEWYRKSIEGLEGTDGGYPANVAWARRYIAQAAWSRADFAAAAEQLEALAGAADATVDDLDRLAGARARLGQWSAAVAAWQRAEKADPADANRARYCWRLAAMAEKLPALPERAPSGKPWGSLSKEELETLMAEQAGLVKDAVGSVTSGAAGVDRDALQGKIDAAKPVFVRAGVEYAVRRYPIRETAFLGGYAPLIFHETRWQLPAAD